MGKRKVVWGGGCEGGKGRWHQKAMRNKAKLNKREKEKHRTVTRTTTKSNKQKPNQKMTASSDGHQDDTLHLWPTDWVLCSNWRFHLPEYERQHLGPTHFPPS